MLIPVRTSRRLPARLRRRRVILIETCIKKTRKLRQERRIGRTANSRDGQRQVVNWAKSLTLPLKWPSLCLSP